LKQKVAKELLNLEIDTPVFVNSHKQYGVIRKVIKTGQVTGSSLQEEEKKGGSSVIAEQKPGKSDENQSSQQL
jgi:hypothetical protein